MVDTTLTTYHALPLAYLDGGTGSMLIQAAFAGVLTAGYFLKTQWAAVKAVVSRRAAK